jgi:hypothetical protein
MPTRREDVLWSVVHQRSSHLRALIDSLPAVDVDVRYELDYYPYAIIDLLFFRAHDPPLVLRSVYVQANRQWEYHSEFVLRVIDAALRLVEGYRADPSAAGAIGV